VEKRSVDSGSVVTEAAMRTPLLCCLLLALIWTPSDCSPDDSRLLDDLMTGYDRRVRPVSNNSQPVGVSLGVTLQTLDIDEETNVATLILWMNFEWNDYRLQWNESDYGGIEDIRLMPDQVWMPDIMPYNLMPAPRLDWLNPTPLVVSSSGGILYVPTAAVQIKARRDFHTHNDHFTIDVKFGSWTYNGFKLDLTLQSEQVDFSSYVPNVMWELQSGTLRRNVLRYECCPEPYLDVTAKLTLTRPDHLGVMPNLPMVVSLVTSAAAFLVPVDSPQKLTLPCLALLAAGGAAATEFGLRGDAEYRAHFLRAYHLYTYAALAVLVWAVLVVLLGRPRALRLPACLRRCLGIVCCLPPAENKTLCREWTALAELLDRLVGVAFLVLAAIGFVTVRTAAPA